MNEPLRVCLSNYLTSSSAAAHGFRSAAPPYDTDVEVEITRAWSLR